MPRKHNSFSFSVSLCQKITVLIFGCFGAAMVIFFCFTGCQPNSNTETSSTIAARDDGLDPTRPIIYRAKVPTDWLRQDPPQKESIADTKKSICEFLIKEDGDSIKITIHNFPTHSIEERIPPIAQVNRWKRQFESIDPAGMEVKPQAFGGFVGLFFEATGTMQGKSITVLGWSMQLAPEHYRSFAWEYYREKDPKFLQMNADYTIKVLGNPSLVAKYKQQITKFARSFELIEEIPTRS